MTHDNNTGGYEAKRAALEESARDLFGLDAYDTLIAIADKYPESSVEYEKIFLAIQGLFFIASNKQGVAFKEFVRDWEKKEPLTDEQHEYLHSFGLECACCPGTGDSTRR